MKAIASLVTAPPSHQRLHQSIPVEVNLISKCGQYLSTAFECKKKGNHLCNSTTSAAVMSVSNQPENGQLVKQLTMFEELNTKS